MVRLRANANKSRGLMLRANDGECLGQSLGRMPVKAEGKAEQEDIISLGIDFQWVYGIIFNKGWSSGFSQSCFAAKK